MRRINLALTMLLGFIGLTKSCSQNTPPVSGGHKEYRDECAPIKSNELKGLRTSLFIDPRLYNGKFTGNYTITLKKVEDGKFALSCNDQSVEVGNDVANDIQGIIKKYRLEGLNGLYSVTAGLPPEFQPMNFSAEYASGEKLTFTKNNDPQSNWGMTLFRYVRDVLIAHGDTTYAVKDDEQKIDRLKLEYSAGDGILYLYDNIYDENDKECIYREVWDKNTDKLISEVSVPVPADYYDGLSKLVEKLGVAWIANYMSYNFKPNPKEESYCHIYAGQADSYPLFMSSYRGKEMDGEISSIISQLREYMDKPFEKSKGKGE